MYEELNVDTIRELYLDKKMKLFEIADIYGYGPRQLEFFLRKNNIKKHDTISLSILPNALTQRQISILNGAMLSDGCMGKSNAKRNSNFSVTQSKFPKGKPERTAFVNWIADEFKPFTLGVKEFVTNNSLGYIAKILKISFLTRHSIVFSDLEKSWYLRDKANNYILDKSNKRIKTVPKDIKLDPVTLAVWMMGDGYNSVESRTVTFCTESYSVDDNKFLTQKLKEEFAINATVDKARNRINICGEENYLKIIHLIEPHIVKESFGYKCDLNNYKPVKGHPVGDDWYCTKIKESTGEVDFIFDTFNEGFNATEIAEKFYKKFEKKITTSNVSCILRGIRKTHRKDIVSNVKRPRKIKITKEKSLYRGVAKMFDTDKFVIIFSYKGKSINLGTYDSEIEAAHNFDYHSLKLRENPNLNFPDFDYSNFVPQISEETAVNKIKGIRSKTNPWKKFQGVLKRGNLFLAMMTIKNQALNLGTFPTEIEAAQNYDYHCLKLFENTRYINFPNFNYNEFEPKKVFDYNLVREQYGIQ